MTTDGGGQIVAGAGTANNGDQNLYDTADNTSANAFAVNKRLGAVLVVDGAAGTLTLYVNGATTSQSGALTGETIQPFGSNNGTVAGFMYGLGVVGNNGGNNSLQGDITQAQIYGSALSATDALALSSSIGADSSAVPEPSTWLMASGFLVLTSFCRYRSGWFRKA